MINYIHQWRHHQWQQHQWYKNNIKDNNTYYNNKQMPQHKYNYNNNNKDDGDNKGHNSECFFLFLNTCSLIHACIPGLHTGPRNTPPWIVLRVSLLNPGTVTCIVWPTLLIGVVFGIRGTPFPVAAGVRVLLHTRLDCVCWYLQEPPT